MNEPSANEPLHAAGYDVPAEDSPVPAGPATLPMGSRAYPGPDTLILRSPLGSKRPFFIGIFFIPVVYTVAMLIAGDRPHMLASAFVLSLFTLGAIWFWYRQVLLPRVTFDKDAGVLSLGWRGRRGRRPLSSVIGVQIMQTRKQFGGQEHNIPAVTMYQMNLILDDPAERRLNVTTSDPLTARSTAQQVADFLGVPVLDRGATATAAAEPTLAEMATVPSPIVTEPRPDVLLIRPHRLAFLSGFRWAGLMGLGLVVCLLADQVSRGYLVAMAGAWLFFSPLALLPTLCHWARFDRAAGLITLGWMAPRRRRTLASVKAVEVVSGADHQLNLLPDDPQQPRTNIITDTDGALVRRAAERVASFLGVPLVGSGRPAAGGGNPLELLNRSPLPSGKTSVRGPARLVPKGGDVLVLRPGAGLRWIRLLPALLTLGVELGIVWFVFRGAGVGRLGDVWPLIFVLVVGSLSQLVVLKPLLQYRDRFDRQAGLLTLGWFGLKGTYPLDKVRAVQLIPGGLVQKIGAFGRGDERISYQMNLVLADDDQDRLNLIDDTDLDSTRRAGQQLAEFLGVPLIDQIADED